MKPIKGKAQGRDAISLSLEEDALESRNIIEALERGVLTGNSASRAERKLERLSLHANLLWRIRQEMVDLSMS